MDNEERPDYQQQAEQARRRYEAEHPLHDRCLTHPDRLRAPGGHYCAECRENHRRNYEDDKRTDDWRKGDQYDMRYYSDHPRYSREGRK